MATLVVVFKCGYTVGMNIKIIPILFWAAKILAYVLFVFGIVEVGRLIMVQQVISNAAREGARMAVVPGRTDDQVIAVVDDYVTRSMRRDVTVMTGYTRTIAPSLSTAAPYERIAVTVSVAYSDVAWLDSFLGSPTMLARAYMRKEI